MVKSRNELVHAVYDDQADVHERNIDSHIKRLRKKFTANELRIQSGRDTVRCWLLLQGNMSTFRAPPCAGRRTSSLNN